MSATIGDPECATPATRADRPAQKAIGTASRPAMRPATASQVRFRDGVVRDSDGGAGRRARRNSIGVWGLSCGSFANAFITVDRRREVEYSTLHAGENHDLESQVCMDIGSHSPTLIPTRRPGA